MWLCVESFFRASSHDFFQAFQSVSTWPGSALLRAINSGKCDLPVGCPVLLKRISKDHLNLFVMLSSEAWGVNGCRIKMPPDLTGKGIALLCSKKPSAIVVCRCGQ